jgi:hypothetical protein
MAGKTPGSAAACRIALGLFCLSALAAGADAAGCAADDVAAETRQMIEDLGLQRAAVPAGRGKPAALRRR